MDYAIIRAGDTQLLEVIKLTDWESYEWNDFRVVRERETGDIKWFEKEEEAIAFLFDYFDRAEINPTYWKNQDRSGMYYIG